MSALKNGTAYVKQVLFSNVKMEYRIWLGMKSIFRARYMEHELLDIQLEGQGRARQACQKEQYLVKFRTLQHQ